MTWQGTPFPLRSEDIFYHADVLLNKIPRVFVELPDKGWNFETFVTALVAGGIPAFVAWLAMRANNRSMQQQLEQQERITRMTLTVEHVITNRKKQIEELRHCSANFLAYAQSAANQANAIIIKRKSDPKLVGEFIELHNAQLNFFQLMSMERWNIRLLLDKNDSKYEIITKAMSDILHILNNPNLYPDGYKPEHFYALFETIEAGIRVVIEEHTYRLEQLN
jgi:hypothetical protein